MNRYRFPPTDLRSKAKPNRAVEVKFSVSYDYNGGVTAPDGKWYQGYEVPAPTIPETHILVSLGVGLQLNAHPPYATMLLKPRSLATPAQLARFSKDYPTAEQPPRSSKS